jgi:hypothetical protein
VGESCNFKKKRVLDIGCIKRKITSTLSVIRSIGVNLFCGPTQSNSILYDKPVQSFCGTGSFEKIWYECRQYESQYITNLEYVKCT